MFNPTETAIVFDPKTGAEIFRAKGNHDTIEFDKAQWNAMRDNIATHNHPSGTSFSIFDVNVLAAQKAREIRAVGKREDGTVWRYRMYRDSDDPVLTTAWLQDTYNRRMQETQANFWKQWKPMLERKERGELSQQDMDAFLEKMNMERNHVIWEGAPLASAGLKYEAKRLT